MIKFFRKIRYDLMGKNKTGKYFKYAIGEIVLVVIGILIALSINNWNENRKVQKQAYNQLLEVQNEILNNILEFDDKGNYYNEKLRDLRRVFSDTLVFEDYKNQRSLSRIMSSYYSVDTQNEAFNKLIQNADNLPDKYKPLILEIKKLYNLSNYEQSYQSLLLQIEKYFDFVKDFNESVYRHERDDYITFLMTNKEYKNKLAKFSFTLDDITPNLAIKKFKAIEIYRQMITLGFPDKKMPQLEKMFIAINPETAAAFIGRYTNNIDTLTINYNKKDNSLFGSWSSISREKIEDSKVMIKDTSSLNMEGGSCLEFNDDKTMFFTLQAQIKPHYKRILEAN